MNAAVGRVAIAHDYLTQRGGAERVVLSLAEAFPGAPIFTSLYDPEGTFDEFRGLDVHVSPLDRVPILRQHHRLALPLLAPTFSRIHVDADIVVCSSSGWAHGVRARGRKVVYCHAPARWLYQRERYAPERLRPGSLALAALRPSLLRWDLRAAATADRYVVNSTLIGSQVFEIYGVDAEVLPPPPTIDPAGPRVLPAGIAAGFFLCVSRLLPYKNVAAVVGAFAGLPDERLVVVGEGPQLAELRTAAPSNVRFLGTVGDDVLRGLYDGCRALVAAAYEDFGLTPLEAASFGRPTAALRYGGYLDTVVEGRTGVFFEEPSVAAIRDAVGRVGSAVWDETAIGEHADQFSEARFVARIREIAALEAEQL